MAWVYHNPNPARNLIGDCTIRAVSTLLGLSWDEVYLDICLLGFILCDMPSADKVWGEYLNRNGFKKEYLSGTCVHSYTVKDFCKDHSTGGYALGTGSHVVAVVDGDYYDIWDSGDEVPIYFWRRE